MKLSELCTVVGLPSATVKYYLREGLVPSGARVSATRAEYVAAHVDRLRLVRALVEGAGMSIDGVRRVVDALDHPPESRHDLLGVAQGAIDGPSPEVAVAHATRAALDELGWGECRPDRLGHLQSALDTAQRAGVPVPAARLASYARAMLDVAQADIAGFDEDPDRATPVGAVRYVAVGTVVTDAVLIALRRLAQEQVSASRFASAGPTASERHFARATAAAVACPE